MARALTPILEPRLPHALSRTLAADRLLDPGERVLVALSGGLDSTVLLHLLRFALPELDLDVHAAHLDHAMRPGSADDAAWVRGLCRAWEVPLTEERIREPPGSEAGARALRYAFLEAAADGVGASRVVTAHHADDQAETVLFRAIRGSGMHGLAGIPARRGRIVRPLLGFDRAELAGYAERARVAHLSDPTNVQARFARNRIRHEVMPLLEEIAPGAARSLVHLSGIARRRNRAWRSAVEALSDRVIERTDPHRIQLARTPLLSYDLEIRSALLRLAARRLGVVADRRATRAMLDFASGGRSGTSIDLPRGVRMERELDAIVLLRSPESPGASEEELTIASRGGEGMVRVGARSARVRWRIIEGAEDTEGTGAAEAGAAEPDPLPGGSELLRCASLRFPLRVRAWRPGDRIRQAYGTKKLKKLLLEARIPRSRRRETLVVEDGSGTVVCVVGLARAPEVEPVPGEPALNMRVWDV